MRADRRDPIIAALRRYKPSKFEATMRDGTRKTIALSTKQNRWEILSETLETMPWVSIEALDDKGTVLGAVEREDDGDLEVVDDDMDRTRQFAAIIATTVQQTMKECRLMFGDTMKAHAEMAGAMLDSVRVVNESYQTALKVTSMAIGEAPVDPESSDKVMQMLGMAMALMKGGSPSVTVGVSPPAGAKVANGVKKS